MDRLTHSCDEFHAPRLHKVALTGPIGRFVDAHAHLVPPESLLYVTLATIGICLGRKTFVRYHGRPVYMSQFAVMIGDPGQAGFVLDLVNEVLAPFEFPVRRVSAGVSSEQSLILVVNDVITKPERMNTEKGTPPVLVPTVFYEAKPKQVIITQRGFPALLTGSTVKPRGLRRALRAIWHGEDLVQSVALHDGAWISSTNAHVGITTSCDYGQFSKLAPDFASLFLVSSAAEWNRVSMFGSPTPIKGPALENLQEMIVRAVTLMPDGEVRIQADAQNFILGELEKCPRETREVISTKILKTALTYAHCSCSHQIELEHARAAVAVVEHSVLVEIFVRRLASEAKVNSRIASKIISGLGSVPDGLSQTKIRRQIFHNHVNREQMSAAFEALESAGRIIQEKVRTRGRSETVWRLVRGALGA